MDRLLLVIDFLLTHKMIFSVLIISFIFLLRHYAVKHIRGDIAFLTEDQRKWISRTKNGSFTVIVITLFILWQSEINEFALSVTEIGRAHV